MRHLQRTLAVGVVGVVAAVALVVTSGASGATARGARDPKSALPDVNQHFKATGPLTASAPGITDKTIKIGYITSQSGLAASSFKGGDAGAQARIALQNAQGGVDGRKLVLVTADDGTNGNKTAAQDLVENQGAFGVIDLSAFAIAGAPYLNQQGVPVTGFAIDGPEWGQAPYSNMFTFVAAVLHVVRREVLHQRQHCPVLEVDRDQEARGARVRDLPVVGSEHQEHVRRCREPRHRELLPEPVRKLRPDLVHHRIARDPAERLATACSRRWSTRRTSGSRPG